MISRVTRSFGQIPPSDYLAIAMQLAETPDAAAQRSAIDRAYYATFLTVRDGLVNKSYASFPERPEAHRRVAEALNALTEDMGQRLAILRRARNRLTYQTGQYTLPRGQSLRELLDSARIVIDAVRALPASAG